MSVDAMLLHDLDPVDPDSGVDEAILAGVCWLGDALRVVVWAGAAAGAGVLAVAVWWVFG